jgi:hypothetical protein
MEFSNHIDTLIKLADFERALKLMRNGKSPGEDNISSELEKCAPEEFKLRLWRNAIVIAIFKKGVTEDAQKYYRGISICNTCCQIYSKIFNMKLQSYSEQLMTESQNGFRTGRSCTARIFCLKPFIEK